MRACANMALAVTSVIVATLLCEAGLRMVGFANPGDFKTPDRGMAPRFYYLADPHVGHDIAKNFPADAFLLPDYIRTYGAPFSVSSNNLGCRDRAVEPEDGYLLLIGDSYTWGYTALEQTWGTTLEQLLSRRIVKCGVPGYGPRQERHKLDAIARQVGNPRVVIVGYVMNDLLDDYLHPSRTVTDGYLVNKVALIDSTHGDREIRSEEVLRARLRNTLSPQVGFISGTKRLLGKYSILYDRLTHAEALKPVTSRLGIDESQNPLSDLEAFRSVKDFPWLGEAWDQHLENLRQLKSSIDQLGASMLVVIFPDARQIYDALRPQQGLFQWDYPNQRLAEFFARENIAFLDLLPEFRQYASCRGRSMPTTEDDLYWAHDDHPNIKGNRIAGLFIGRHVLERSPISIPDKEGRLSEIQKRISAETSCIPTKLSMAQER